MAQKKQKLKNSYVTADLRWHFGKVGRLVGKDVIRPMKGKYIGGDDLQRVFQPNISKSMQGARALVVTTFVEGVRNTLRDCQTVLNTQERTDEKPVPFIDTYHAKEIKRRCEDILSFIGPSRSSDEIKFDRDLYKAQRDGLITKEIRILVHSRMSEMLVAFQSALESAIEAGRLITEAEWRSEFGEPIRATRDRRRKLVERRDGHNQRKQAKAKNRRAMVKSMMNETKLTGGALDLWLIKTLKLRHGICVSDSTIRKDKRVILG